MQRLLLAFLLFCSMCLAAVLAVLPIVERESRAKPTHRAWPADKPLPLTYGEILENDRLQEENDKKAP